MPCPIRFGPLPRMMHRRLGARLDLGLLVVGRVVVGRQGRELGRAGVDGLEDRAHPERPPHAADDLVGRCRSARAIWASEKPCRLASRSSSGVSVVGRRHLASPPR